MQAHETPSPEQSSCITRSCTAPAAKAGIRPVSTLVYPTPALPLFVGHDLQSLPNGPWGCRHQEWATNLQVAHLRCMRSLGFFFGALWALFTAEQLGRVERNVTLENSYGLSKTISDFHWHSGFC